MQKRGQYVIVGLSLSTEINDILNDIIKKVKKDKGVKITKSRLIESLLYDSLKQTYIQSKLQEENKEENKL